MTPTMHAKPRRRSMVWKKRLFLLVLSAEPCFRASEANQSSSSSSSSATAEQSSWWTAASEAYSARLVSDDNDPSYSSSHKNSRSHDCRKGGGAWRSSAAAALGHHGGHTAPPSPPEYPTPPWEIEDEELEGYPHDYLDDNGGNDDDWYGHEDGLAPDGLEDSLDADPAESWGEAEEQPSRLKSPLVYRYYGRNQSRRQSAGSIPIILLGPNVDHWKGIGPELAARGFSVIACERTVPGDEADAESSTNLLIELMDALRWSKAVLVGCDAEAVAAVLGATHLAPDRIVGLVLCGNLQSAYQLAAAHEGRNQQQYQQQRHYHRHQQLSLATIDRFLGRYLDCPYTIVWDGDDPDHQQPVPSSSSGSGNAHGSRSLVIGGGIAPHRRRPKLFAWILTRFVEERIAPTTSSAVVQAPRAGGGAEETGHHYSNHNNSSSSNSHSNRPEWYRRLRDLLAPESRVVMGRMMAAALLYGTAMKVCIVQIENIRGGIHVVATFRQRILQGLVSFMGLFVGRWPGRPATATTTMTSEEAIHSDVIINLRPNEPMLGNATNDEMYFGRQQQQQQQHEEQYEEEEEEAEEPQQPPREEQEHESPEPPMEPEWVVPPAQPPRSVPDAPKSSEQFRPIFFLDQIVA